MLHIKIFAKKNLIVSRVIVSHNYISSNSNSNLLSIDNFRVSIIILRANTGQISVECSDLACYLELPL